CDPRQQPQLPPRSSSDLTDGALWPQTLVLLTHLSDKMKGVMGDVTVSLGETVMAKVAPVTREHSLWEPWMLSVAHMQASNRQQVMAMSALLDDGLLTDWLEIGRAHV